MDDDFLVGTVLDMCRNHSIRETADRLGVSHETVARWRRAEWTRLNAATRRQLIGFIERAQAHNGNGLHADRLRDDVMLPLQDDDNVVGMLLRTGLVRRLVESVGPPGYGTASKLQILEGYRDMIVPSHALPIWWHDVREAVQREEL